MLPGKQTSETYGKLVRVILGKGNLAAAADDLHNGIYRLGLSVLLPLQEDIKQCASIIVQLVVGARIDRVNEPDHIVIDGVNHQTVEAGARQGEKKFGILVKEQEGVADMRCIVEAVCSEGAAAFLQIALDDLVQIIIQGICLGLEIVVESHPGDTRLLNNIGDRNLLIIPVLHKGDHRFTNTLPGEAVSFCKIFSKNMLHQRNIPLHNLYDS